MVSRRLACVALLATLALGARAQEAEHALRGRAMGEVRDRENRPWVGAEVVLVSRPVPHALHLGEEDRVVAVTDERGRFYAEVLCGRPYTAWAWGEVKEGGRLATQVVERVFAQRPILLRAERRLERRSVRLTETEPWAKLAPFELRVVDGTMNRQATWVDAGDAGEAELPFVVGNEAWVDVFGKGRYPIARLPLGLRAPPGRIDLALPAATETALLVHRLGTSQPLAGATILRRLDGECFAVTTTDAVGRATVAVPRSEVPHVAARDTLVRAPECRMGVASRAGDVRNLPGVQLPEKAKDDDHYACLTVAPTLHGRVLGLDGQPIAGVQLWCFGTATNAISSSVAIWEAWQNVVATDGRGAFTIADEPRVGRAALLVLRERDYALLPARWRRGLLPVVFAPLLAQPGRGTKDDPVVVRLDAMCPVELEFRGAGGAPDDIEVNVDSLTQSSPSLWGWWGGDVAADARGRVRLLLPAGQRLGFRAVSGLSMLVRGFETSRAFVDADAAFASFALPSPASIAGQVLDKNGDPTAGKLVFASFGTSNTPADWQYESEDVARVAQANHNAVRVINPTERAQQLALTILVSRRAVADAEGRFVLPMPPEPMPDLLLHTMDSGVQRTIGGSHNMRWSGESQQDVVVRLPF